MNDATTQDSIEAGREVPKWRQLLKELARAPLSAQIGMLVIQVYVFVAIFAPWSAPRYRPYCARRK